MKRFRFRLQKVLDVRELGLTDAQRALATALALLEQAEQVRALRACERDAAEARIAGQLGAPAFEARFLLALHEDLACADRALTAARVAAARAARQVETARDEVLKKRTEVESLQLMRERAEKLWEEDMRRQEMADMDELASVRHQRRARDEKVPC